MAKCWLATWTSRVEAGGGSYGLPATSSFHPEQCGFCDMPRDLLVQALEEFQSWSQISSYDEEQPVHFEIEAWNTLSPAQQDIKVRQAQGYNAGDRGRTDEDRRSPW